MSLCARYRGTFGNLFDDKDGTTLTEVIVNRIVGQGHPLFVIAAHTDRFETQDGVDNGSTLVPLSMIDSRSRGRYEVIDIHDLNGKFKITPRFREEKKLPVVHLNETNLAVNAMFVNFQLFMPKTSNEKWYPDPDHVDRESFFRRSRRHSPDGNFVSSMLVGFFKFGDVICRSFDSYSILDTDDHYSAVVGNLLDEQVKVQPNARILTESSIITVKYKVTSRGLTPFELVLLKGTEKVVLEIQRYGLDDSL